MKRLIMALALLASPVAAQTMPGTYAPNARVVIGKYDPSLSWVYWPDSPLGDNR